MRSVKQLSGSLKHRGFTLVELLVAMLVASIVLTAVATLAYAMGTANDVTDDTRQKQAQLRYATLRLSNLISHCKLVCGTPGDDLVIWRADDNGNGQINVTEVVYIERGSAKDRLQLCEFLSFTNPTMNLSAFGSPTTKFWLQTYSFEKYTLLIPQCSNAGFAMDATPPWSKFVNISFNLSEHGADRQYQISATLHNWAGNLLNDTGTSLVSDDD